jgi:hypothetical protein
MTAEEKTTRDVAITAAMSKVVKDFVRQAGYNSNDARGLLRSVIGDRFNYISAADRELIKQAWNGLAQVNKITKVEVYQADKDHWLPPSAMIKNGILYLNQTEAANMRSMFPEAKIPTFQTVIIPTIPEVIKASDEAFKNKTADEIMIQAANVVSGKIEIDPSAPAAVVAAAASETEARAASASVDTTKYLKWGLIAAGIIVFFILISKGNENV